MEALLYRLLLAIKMERDRLCGNRVKDLQEKHHLGTLSDSAAAE